MKYCSDCGKKIKEGAQYCHNCGSNFSEANKSKVKKINSIKKSKKSIFETYVTSLNKFSTFSGRASRREYWTFYIANILIAFLLAFFETAFTNSNGSLSNMFNLIMVIPSISVAVRRMHDVNQSGLYIIIPIANIILLLRKGNNEINMYGVPTGEQTN